MHALHADAPLNDGHNGTPEAMNLLPEAISQPSKDGDGSSTLISQDELARDTSEVSSEMVIEPPERDDVLEHYVFKCFGTYPKMANAFNMTATVIGKHWAKKPQILVHPNELKQTEFRDGPVASTGMAEVVRLPFGTGGVAWESGLDEIVGKTLRCSPDILHGRLAEERQHRVERVGGIVGRRSHRCRAVAVGVAVDFRGG